MATAKKPGTAVAKPKSTGVSMPSEARQKMMDELKARLAAPSGDKIKIDNKQFKLPSGEILDFLDVVIVDFVYKNEYYETGYVKGEYAPPSCVAMSPDSTGMVPLAASPDVQSASCQGCAMNQFGTAGKGKACKNRVLVAVLARNADITSPLIKLDLSPTAVKAFESHIRNIGRVLQKLPYEVMSHVECNPALKEDVAMFSDPQPIDDPEFIEMVESRLEEARQYLMTPPDLSANDAAPKGKTKLAAPKRRAA